MLLKDLRGRHLAISKKLNDIHTAAESRDGKLNDTEKTEWDSLVTEQTDIEDRIKRAELLEGRGIGSDGDYLATSHDRASFSENRKSFSADNDDPNRPLTQYEYTRAFTAWGLGQYCEDEVGMRLADRTGLRRDQKRLNIRLKRGCDISGMPFSAPRTVQEAREQARKRTERREAIERGELRELTFESRANNYVNFTAATGLKAADGSPGGYITPDSMIGPLDEALLRWGGMRQVATVVVTDNGETYRIPTVDDTGNVAEILAEAAAMNEQAVAFGNVELGSFTYSSKAVKISVELLQDSILNLPVWLGTVLGTRIGRGTNAHFTVGTGTSQPRGVVTAGTSSGVTTASATAITHDEFLTLKHSVDPAYRDNGTIMFADATLLIFKKLKDSQGRPIWLPSLAAGEPGTIDGSPYVVNQAVASGASAKSVVYGDLSKYIIRDVSTITLQRLDELYAANRLVGFHAFSRHDGDLVDAGTHPVKYLTMHA